MCAESAVRRGGILLLCMSYGEDHRTQMTFELHLKDVFTIFNCIDLENDPLAFSHLKK